MVELWGFKHCRDIKIHIPSNGIVTITAEFSATREQMEQLSGLLKKYELHEIGSPSVEEDEASYAEHVRKKKEATG